MDRIAFNAFSQQIAQAMQKDQPGLRQHLRRLKQRQAQGQPIDQSLEKFSHKLSSSCSQRQQRAEQLPAIAFPEELPISAERERIAEAIQNHQVVVVAGETGSGKTTQLPKLCLSVGRGIAGLIGCTQPRRIAARSISSRIASELNTEPGSVVGYKVRFHDHTNDNSYIKLMTDGILLAEIQQDPYLNQYDTLIIDEAHERSLNIDFLLGYLKQLLPKRRDLKLIITSATIDTARFSEHFADAPIIEVSGRTYPVEVRYRPWEEAEDRDLSQAILAATDEIANELDGDILVFLPGEREIRDTAEALRKHHPPHTEILPLYARLSSAEQDKVFKPGSQRRIVLATNVAETSLTVPRIRAVIDPGLARISRYSARSKVQHLQIEPVSQASANQRKGRCGRIGPGLCIRLYSEADFNSRREYTEPEILRSSLASVILRMLHLGLGDIAQFPFVEAPNSKMINDGFKLLEELSAVDKQRQLTAIGRQLAPLPIDPRIGRMVLAAQQEGCVREVLIIAAALSIQDPRERPQDAQQAADQAQAEFRDKESDFLSYVKLWEFFHEQEQQLSKNKLRKLCQKHFVSYLRMLEWQDIHRQLFTLVREHAGQINQEPAEYNPIHRALLTGLLGNIAVRENPVDNSKKNQENQKDKPRQKVPDTYLGARGLKYAIFPGSGVAKKKPKWMMAAELIETSRLFAHCVAKIEPEWIEAAAGDLCKRSYSEPHWEKRSAQVAAFERVTLYGLSIVANRKINYGPIDPELSRELFIRGALVNGEYFSRAPFFVNNLELIEEIQELEHKARRQDILVDEQQIFSFFDARIPPDIYTGAAFEKWRKHAEKQQPKLLFLDREALMRREAGEINNNAFPDHLDVQGASFPLTYQLEPGRHEDGVTIHLPIQVLNQLQPAIFEWLVPGLREEKITELIRSLPKQLRKNFVPVPDYARAASEALDKPEGSLLHALANYLQRISGVAVAPDAWQLENLSTHLRMNFCVYDEDDKLLAQGRDLSQLQAECRHHTKDKFAKVSKQHWEQQGMTDWECGELPEFVELKHQGVTVRAIPALVDKQDHVDLQLFDDVQIAARTHRQGLLRLFMLKSQSKIKDVRKPSVVPQDLCLKYSPLGRCDDLKAELASKVSEAVFLAEQPWPRNQEAFEARLKQGQQAFFPELNRQSQILRDTLDAWHEVAKDFKTRLPIGHLPALDEIKKHANTLVYQGFLKDTPLKRLPYLPRYLKASRLRLDKIQYAPDKDAQKAAEIDSLWENYQQAFKNQTHPSDELINFRWLLEELRVSLFAQELKTVDKVSVKRLEKQWQEIAKTL